MSGFWTLVNVVLVLIEGLGPGISDWYYGYDATKNAIEILEKNQNAIFTGVAVQICDRWVNEKICPLEIEADFSEIKNLGNPEKVAFFKKQEEELVYYDQTCREKPQEENLKELSYKIKVFINPEIAWKKLGEAKQGMALSFERDPSQSYKEQLEECLTILNKKEKTITIGPKKYE